MCSKNLLGKINAYMALHQRLGSEGNGDFPTIASQLGAEPKLDFPLEKSSGPANEPIEIYVIPDDRKEEALKKLYPFHPLPSLDSVMYDIHEDKTFVVKDFIVIRDHGLNFLVSPYFRNSGGSVLDWISKNECRDEDDGTELVDVKMLDDGSEPVDAKMPDGGKEQPSAPRGPSH